METPSSSVSTRLRAAPFGVVVLKDWMPNPETGHQVQLVAGPLEMVTAKESFGFQPKGNESNWGIRVGTDNYGVLILGCQIKSVYWGRPFPSPKNNSWDLSEIADQAPPQP